MNLKRPRLLAIGLPMLLMSQCAPDTGCAPPAPSVAPKESVAQQQARQSAAEYLLYVPGFSRLGLIDQLLYEQFSYADAVYGVDAQHADWFQQAAISAADYLRYVGGFSRGGMISQLLYERFTQSEAEYGASSVGLY